MRLYIDEDIHRILAEQLRQRGFDAISVEEAGRRGLSDSEQFDYAIANDRVIVVFNQSDYIPLIVRYFQAGIEFPGVIVSTLGDSKDRRG